MAKKDKVQRTSGPSSGEKGIDHRSPYCEVERKEPTADEQSYIALGIKAEDVFAQKFYDDRLVVVTRDGRKLTHLFKSQRV